MSNLIIYNTLTRQKEEFKPIKPPFVGMYLCGPTVYGRAHLGHARSAIAFDVVYRYLKYLDYKVRLVRNITDVGHLERDSDDGLDKIAKQARIEALDPMEIAQIYTSSYRRDMFLLNVMPPTIEPLATGHITEQIKMIEKIIDAGFAYITNGSVYFDVEKYNTKHNYGILSRRTVDELLSETRILQSQSDKKFSADFALWKKASNTHIMKWPSPWSFGFPGWHIECSAIASKYLGHQFDIHAGGIDLLFPHHECEIAQSNVAFNSSAANYWMHNNLITINGQKMSKSLDNFITLEDLFEGNSYLLDQAYSPMALRFFVLQSHYRNPLAFSLDALKAAYSGYIRIINGLVAISQMEHNIGIAEKDPILSKQIETECRECFESINDDFNTAKVISCLFSLLKHINNMKSAGCTSIIEEYTFENLRFTYTTFVQAILGLRQEKKFENDLSVINLLLEIYNSSKLAGDYKNTDLIRNSLHKLGISVHDTRFGTDWSYSN